MLYGPDALVLSNDEIRYSTSSVSQSKVCVNSVGGVSNILGSRTCSYVFFGNARKIAIKMSGNTLESTRENIYLP